MSTTLHTVAPPRVDAAPDRPDVAAKIDGTFVFANDEHTPGMLHGATVRSPHAHARIAAVRTAGALAAEHTVAVFTIDDVPGARRVGHIIADQPPFADGVVRYVGEPVAFVVARTAAAARLAAELVEVDYEPLPVLDDPERALGADVPQLHPGGNLIRRLRLRRGTPEAGAPVVVSGEWRTGRQDQAFLAPESALAVPDADGGVTLRLATQDLHTDRAQVAAALDLPEEMVRLELSGVGGAFGGREDITLQVHLALAARVLDRPVSATYRRSESFLSHPQRHPARLTYELGADRDGTLRFVRAHLLLDGGAYASTSGPVLATACYMAAGPYRVPSAEVVGESVYTNNPVAGAMRGFGAVQACFGIESTMDLLAVELGMDPVELRRRNALRPGDVFPTSGQPVGEDVPVLELIDRCLALPPPPPPPGRQAALRRGTGFALGVKNHLYAEGVPEHSTATVRVHPDRVEVLTAAVECGQGIDGVVCRIVADELGDAMGDRPVRLARPTSDMAYSGSSSASRQTWMTGNAVRLAARDVRAQLDRAGADPAALAVEATSTYLAPPTDRGADGDGQGHVHVSWMWVAHRAVVDVDPELGTVAVVQVATAQDVGRALNRRQVIGQIHGGISQGVGLALTEDLTSSGGRPLNASFADYLVPTVAEMPDVEVALVESSDPRSPLGVKGAGEPPSLSSTAAVAAAIRAATGRPVPRVPVRPEDLVL